MVHVASGREWRGGQHQVLVLARELHERGVSTTVVTGADSELADRLATAHVPVERVPWRAGLDPRVVTRLLQVISSSTIVHAHDSHAHALADVVARLRRAPLVVTRRVDFVIRNASRYQRARAIVAVSNAVARQCTGVGFDPARIFVVPDAIDPEDQVDDLTTWPMRSQREIVTVAALAREKGIDVLLRAAALVHATHPDLCWVVVGDGDERRALEKEREALGLRDVVSFPGAGPAAAAFRGATLVVQPSRSEGLGSAVLQALAQGVPVVASDVGGLPDALAHGGGILVPSDSPMELAQAVRRLLEDDEARRALGAAGRQAAQWFTVDRLVERMAHVYRSLESTPDGE